MYKNTFSRDRILSIMLRDDKKKKKVVEFLFLAQVLKAKVMTAQLLPCRFPPQWMKQPVFDMALLDKCIQNYIHKLVGNTDNIIINGCTIRWWHILKIDPGMTKTLLWGCHKHSLCSAVTVKHNKYSPRVKWIHLWIFLKVVSYHFTMTALCSAFYFDCPF